MNKLILNHLYSKSLNIYGDLGNVITLKHLCHNLGIELEVVSTEIGDKFKTADIYFMGGGQDKDQMVVYEDLLKHKTELKNEFEKGKIFLLICGGFQLFGEYFVDGQGNNIPGLNILPMVTKALDSNVSSRSIGNLVVQMSDEFVQHWGIDTEFSKYLVGFENHGGQSFLKKTTNEANKTIEAIGKVVCGKGNNATEKIEGAWVNNLIGCYMHGSLLPKNPHLALAIIRKAFINRHSGLDPESSSKRNWILNPHFAQLRWGEQVQDDNYFLEKKAHEEILTKLKIKN